MCHLCRKLEALQAELNGTALKPISALILRLHNNIQPGLENFWFMRHEQAVKLRGLLSKLHEAAPIRPLSSILETVDRELEHIRKNMPDHLTDYSTGKLATLKERISPGSSASLAASGQAEQSRNDGQRGQRKRRHKSERTREASDAMIEVNSPPDLPGSDLNPPQARVQRSTEVVQLWLQRGNEDRS